MKKQLLLLFITMLLSQFASAQHLKFNGVEITGQLNECVNKLMSKGWSEIKKDFLNGDPHVLFMKKSSWAGYNNVEISVSATPKKNITYLINVFIPSLGSDEIIIENIKNMLVSVYGEPENSDLHYVYTIYDNHSFVGIVMLNKTPFGNSICISYSDFEGHEIFKDEAKSDL